MHFKCLFFLPWYSHECREVVFWHKWLNFGTKNWCTWPMILAPIFKHITTSWGCWKHLFGTPGVRPMFLKPKFHKESKNGFKTITYRCYPVMIFSKNWFWSKKFIKKVGCFVDFWIFMVIYMDKLDQFRKFNCRTFRIRWNITKMLKTEQFFHEWIFIFENQVFEV